MPAKSRKQQRFAAMSFSPKGRAKLKSKGVQPMPVKVAKDFRRFLKGKKRNKGTRASG